MQVLLWQICFEIMRSVNIQMRNDYPFSKADVLVNMGANTFLDLHAQSSVK